MRILAIALLLAVAGRGLAAAEVTDPPADSFEELLTQLEALRPDPKQSAAVQGLVIQRGPATFALQAGMIYLCEKISGRDSAALFQGKGVFSFKVRDPVERGQIERFFGVESLEVAFTELGLIFGDSTAVALTEGLHFGAIKPPTSIGDLAADLRASIYDKDSGHLDPTIAKSLLQGGRDGMFYAYLADTDKGPLFMSIDPSRSEEVLLLRRPRGSHEKHEQEIISQSRLRPVTQPDESDVRVSLDIDQYTINVKIDHDLDFAARADVIFRMLHEDEKWLDFHLYKKLKVDSVSVDAVPAEFFKGRAAEHLWVRLPRSLGRDESHVIRFVYHGDLIDRWGDWLGIESSTLWYPEHHFMDQAIFDVTYETSKRYQLVSVGRRLSSRESRGFLISRWNTRRPVRNACFGIGFFKEHRVEDARIPPLTVLISTQGHDELKQALGEEGVLSGRHMEKQVGADAANSLAFFQSIFGPPPDSSYYVCDIPGEHGEAFPGLIHLYWGSFQRTHRSGWDQLFRAHEIAHQWWPLGVDYKTYHDQWLSEAFAQYLGLWYMQAALKDNERFFGMLDDWKKEILGNRRYLVGSGQEAGPISLGFRTNTSSTEGDYQLIIYKKGAWVLHMLRNMLIDLHTMSEERFVNMMRDFYQTYRGTSASTNDFQAIAEEHVGEDLSWFFDQWVDGTEIPTYRFSYKVAPAEDGKYRVSCRIEQEGVGEEFRMYVPLLVDFGENRFVRLRARVVGRVSAFDLPLLPMTPRQVLLNDLSSVLCEVKNVGWEE